MLLNRTRKRNKKNQEGSWAISYVDMLTLLLCFFIIFYNNNKANGEKKETLLNQIAVGMSERQQGNSQVVVGKSDEAQTTKASRQVAKSDPNTTHETALLDTIQNDLKQDFGANIVSKDQGLEISFEGVSFFLSGKTDLRPEGRQTIEKIIGKLAANKDQIHLTVQGHTDPTKTKKRPNYSDNWELSVLRATSVLKLFIKNGYSQELLSAEGFADTRAERAIASLTSEDLAKMRRITLRIEPVKVKQ